MLSRTAYTVHTLHYHSSNATLLGGCCSPRARSLPCGRANCTYAQGVLDLGSACGLQPCAHQPRGACGVELQGHTQVRARESTAVTNKAPKHRAQHKRTSRRILAASCTATPTPIDDRHRHLYRHRHQHRHRHRHRPEARSATVAEAGERGHHPRSCIRRYARASLARLISLGRRARGQGSFGNATLLVEARKERRH